MIPVPKIGEEDLLLGGALDAPLNAPATALEGALMAILMNNWFVQASDEFTDAFLAVAADASSGLVLAVGEGLEIHASTNCIDWTSSSGGFGNWKSVAHGNGLWVVAGGDGAGRIDTSPDGESWTTRVSTGHDLNAVAYGNGLWVAVGAEGRVMTSPDGETWTDQGDESFTGTLRAVAYGNGLWVAVGPTTVVRTSQDGFTWISRDLGEGGELNGCLSVTWAHAWIATSLCGDIQTSPDGETWTYVAPPLTDPDLHYNAVASHDRFAVILGTDGIPGLTSTDGGLTWRVVPQSNPASVFGLTWTGRCWVAVGAGGLILTSLHL